MYCNARKDLYGEILESTHHIIFLDTPHSGFDTTKWKSVYGHVATENAREQFDIWSKALTQLSRTFTEIGNTVHITSAHAYLSSGTGADRIEVHV